jgi:hypothetical protein
VHSTTAMTERSLQASITELCQLLGVAWYHTYDSRRSKRGWPDLVLCGSRGFLTRELKTEAGQLTDDQASWGRMLKAVGISWDVWRPADLRSGRIENELRAIR